MAYVSYGPDFFSASEGLKELWAVAHLNHQGVHSICEPNPRIVGTSAIIECVCERVFVRPLLHTASVSACYMI